MRGDSAARTRHGGRRRQRPASADGDRRLPSRRAPRPPPTHAAVSTAPRRSRRLDSAARWPRPPPPTRSSTSTAATTTWRPRDYDAKWGISFGEIGRAQVLGKVAQAARRRARAVRARARDRRRHRLLHAQPDAGRRDRARRPAPTSRPACCETLERNAARARASTSRPSPATPPSCRSTDESFDLVLGHAVLHHLPDLERAFAEFCARAARPAARCSSPASRRATATASPRSPSAPACAPRRCGGARCAPGRRRARHGRRQRRAPPPRRPRARGARRRPRVRARRPRALRRGAGFDDVRVRGEELLANWFGWFNRTLEATAEPTRHPDGRGSSTPTAATCAAGRSTARVLEPRLPAAALLQPDARGAQAGVRPMSSPAGARRGRGSLRARSTSCATRARLVDTGLGPVAFITVNAILRASTPPRSSRSALSVVVAL